jgi:hypothetical protein
MRRMEMEMDNTSEKVGEVWVLMIEMYARKFAPDVPRKEVDKLCRAAQRRVPIDDRDNPISRLAALQHTCLRVIH